MVRRRVVCRRRYLLSSATTIPRPRRPTGPRRRRTTTTSRSWTWRRWRSSGCCKAGSARSRCSRRSTCSPRRPAACSSRVALLFARSHFQTHQSSRLDVRGRVLHAYAYVHTYVHMPVVLASWGRHDGVCTDVPVRSERMGAGVGV
jgi:hypothetical protein